MKRTDGSKALRRKPAVPAGETDLQELFASAGAVERVKVMRDMATGRARGFAFVEMATDEDAQNAINTLHNYSYGGRNLTVNEARPSRRARGGGSGAATTAALRPRW